MQIFLDSAIISELKEAASWGVIDGVTTNPSLIAQSGRKFGDVIKEICAIVDGPISVEVTSDDSTGMVREAEQLAKIHKNIVIKVPVTVEGLKAIRQLAKKGIRTNATLVFSPQQALLVAKAGATFTSPFVGRLDDKGEDGMMLVEEVAQVYRNYGFKTKIIVASVRNVEHVKRAAMCGADIATIPYKVLQQMIRHELTDIGIEKFRADWEKVPK